MLSPFPSQCVSRHFLSQALKGLALVRLGRWEDGANVLKEVHEAKPTDESTLQVITIAYKELNKSKNDETW